MWYEGVRGPGVCRAARAHSGKEFNMIFDFERFSNIAANAYREEDGGYSLSDALAVFQYYFQKYEECWGQPHPPIRALQISEIIKKMPRICLEDKGGKYQDIDPEDYEAMIDRHFETKYRNCNYNINHFFSGRIRELRYFECGF